jgi:hypothetical protein
MSTNDPSFAKVDRLAHERLASVDVCRVEPLGLDLKVFDDLSQWRESRALLANMKVRDARFPREQAADVRVANELRQLLTRLIEPALVGDRDLARAHHLVDEQHVLANGVHDRRWRDVVPAGPHSSGQALARQHLHPCEQPGNGRQRGVDAQRSDTGGDTGAHDFPEKEHRGFCATAPSKRPIRPRSEKCWSRYAVNARAVPTMLWGHAVHGRDRCANTEVEK